MAEKPSTDPEEQKSKPQHFPPRPAPPVINKPTEPPKKVARGG